MEVLGRVNVNWEWCFEVPRSEHDIFVIIKVLCGIFNEIQVREIV